MALYFEIVVGVLTPEQIVGLERLSHANGIGQTRATVRERKDGARVIIAVPPGKEHLIPVQIRTNTLTEADIIGFTMNPDNGYVTIEELMEGL